VGGRFLERENFDEVVVEAQVTAMAFEVRLAQVVVEKGVVFQFGGVEFQRIEVERSFENDKGFVLS